MSKLINHWLFPFSFVIHFKEPEWMDNEGADLFNMFYSVAIMVVIAFFMAKYVS